MPYSTGRTLASAPLAASGPASTSVASASTSEEGGCLIGYVLSLPMLLPSWRRIHCRTSWHDRLVIRWCWAVIAGHRGLVRVPILLVALVLWRHGLMLWGHCLQMLLCQLLLSQSEPFSIPCLKPCRGLLGVWFTVGRGRHGVERCPSCNDIVS